MAGPDAPHAWQAEWARLLRRVFQFDVTKCDACGGPIKRPRVSVIAALTEPGAIGQYLDHVGLPAGAPPITPARQHQSTSTKRPENRPLSILSVSGLNDGRTHRRSQRAIHAEIASSPL